MIFLWFERHFSWSRCRPRGGKSLSHSAVVLSDTWNWSDDNDTISGIEYRDTTAIPEMHKYFQGLEF